MRTSNALNHTCVASAMARLSHVLVCVQLLVFKIVHHFHSAAQRAELEQYTDLQALHDTYGHIRSSTNMELTTI